MTARRGRNRPQARGLRAAAAASLVLALGAGVAAAEDVAVDQPALDAQLDDGMVAVRLIGEDASHPVAGESVTLLGAGDTVLTARTGASGWARFPRRTAGAEYVARVEVDDRHIDSAPIEVPAEGGVRITLSIEQSSQPAQHTPAGAAARGDADGMPDPRQMSGIPRGERGDPPGRLTVRAVQGEFSPTESTAPEDAHIHLIGYGVDGSLTHEIEPVGDEGRVVFDGLAIDRTRSYYVVGIFGRGDRQDRLQSSPITMPSASGVRVMLAGPAPGSDEPAVDDVIEQTGRTSAPVPEGLVVARLFGNVGEVRDVELVEVGDPERPQRSPVARPEPIPSDVQGDLSGPDVDPSLRDGVVVVDVRGQGSDLPGTRVIAAPLDGGESREARTGSDGQARFDDLEPGARYRVKAVVHSREFTSNPFDAPEDGGVRFRLRTTWQAGGMLEARFRDVPSGGDKVYAAQVRLGDRIYRSMPFQLTGERGAAVGVVVFDHVLLRFHMSGELDDELLWFNGQFGMQNPTTAPLVPEGERLTIPLPKGFATANVHDDDQGRVRVGSDGYIWRGPVGPGQEVFRGQFALPIRGGTFEFDMSLPHGSWDSQIILEEWPGMRLRLPDVAGMQRETRPLGGREFTLLSNINIEHDRRLVIGGEGLPQRPLSERYLKWGAGAVGVGLLVWGFAGLFRRRGAEGEDRVASLEAHRERLLDELAQLERQYKRGDVTEARYRRSRENLRIELENVYTELGVGGERKSS